MIKQLRTLSLIAVSGLLLFLAIAFQDLAIGQDGQESPTGVTDPSVAPEAESQSPAKEEKAQQDLIENPLESDLVQVDWIEELFEGGVTMIALGILSIGLLAFLLERFFTLRRRRFVPPALISEVRPLFHEGRYDDILAACEKHPSASADIIRHLVNFRSTDFEVLQSGASDIGARTVIDQEERCSPLSVIAGVAPLLGLLGTMIGMIESFKLVEVFGDEGGASLLAGSISKALITTAVGLILAIPAVLGYHWARRRVHNIATVIETDSEALLKEWFLNGKPAKG